jgi:hypothetical protein
MKSLTRHLTMNVPARMDFVNITAELGGRRPKRVMIKILGE